MCAKYLHMANQTPKNIRRLDRGILLNRLVSGRVKLAFAAHVTAEREQGRRATWSSVAKTMAPLVIPHKWECDQHKAHAQVRTALHEFNRMTNHRSWPLTYLEAFAHVVGIDWRVLLDVPNDTHKDPEKQDMIDVADVMRRVLGQPKLKGLILEVCFALLGARQKDVAAWSVFRLLDAAPPGIWKWKRRSTKSAPKGLPVA